MDYGLTMAAGGTADISFTPTGNLLNNIYLSLMIQQGAWWFNPAFGSRLHLLGRAKDKPASAELARDYCLEALQWLLDSGRAEQIDVVVERAEGRLLFQVNAREAVSGRCVKFDFFREVI